MFNPAHALLTDELRCGIGLAQAIVDPRCSVAEVELTLDCAYSQRHWAAALRRRPWLTASSRPRLRIIEYEAVDWDDVFSGRVVTNNFCVRKGLSRKAPFSAFLAKHASKCAGCPLSAALPATAIVDTIGVFDLRPAWLDFRSAMVEALSDADYLITAATTAYAVSGAVGPAPLFIVKPSLTNKGAEISIVKNLAEVAAAVQRERAIGQWVIQRYVDRPLLLNRRKFHLRVYVLADAALSVHVFGDALVLSAVNPYDAEDQGADRFAHITNTVVGATHREFQEESAVRALSEVGPVLVDNHYAADLVEAEKRVDVLWEDIRACVAHTFFAFEGDFSGYMPLDSAFELYGFDFMLDADWRVILLEANPTPDIRQTGDRLDPMIASLIEGVARIALDSRYPPPLDADQSLPSTKPVDPLISSSHPEWRWIEVLRRSWAGAASSGATGLTMFGEEAPNATPN